MRLADKLQNVNAVSGQQILARVNERGPVLLTLVLVLAIAWQLAQLTWLLVPRPTPVAMPIAPTGQSSSIQTASTVDTAEIRGWHLFGDYDAPPSVVLPRETGLDTSDKTALNLMLIGVVAYDDPRQGLAIIRDAGKDDKLYLVGEPISGSTKLAGVESTRVILDEGGRNTYLALPEFDELPPPTRGRTSTRRTQSSNRVANLRRDLKNNPAKFTDIVRPQPHYANGELRGYRVYPGRQRARFSQLGLRPGDLVTEINGTAMNDPAQGIEVMRSLEGSDQISVTVERNGQPETLSFSLSQLDELQNGTN